MPRILVIALILVCGAPHGTDALPLPDAATEAITTASPRLIGLASISADVTNEGGVTISGLDLNYSLDGVTVFTDGMPGLNIAPGATQNLVHDKIANFATPGLYDLCVWVSNVNYGDVDANPGNDQVCTSLLVLSQIPTHNVIFERHTGAWCGYCPDGRVVAEQVASTHPQAIPVAVHNSDGMEIPDGLTVAYAYGVAYPQATIDRFKFSGETGVQLGRGDWVARVGERIAMAVPASVAIDAQSWDPATRQIQVTVRADFYGPVSGDIRLNAFVVEGSVVGMGSLYDQVSFYNTSAGHPYEGAGNPIVGFDHIDVVRAMLGGPWGLAGVIPSSVGDGDSFAHTFSYPIPAGFDPGNIRLVGLVQMYDSDPGVREILNAASESLVTTGCTLLGGAHQTLHDDTVRDIVTVEVCETITAGPNYHVAGPDGLLTLRAGQKVTLGNGVSVGIDGRLVVDVDPGLMP